jgi:Leucine-rich repeat (LRR) protein
VNKISSIPPCTFSKLKKLEELSLGDNDIERVDEKLLSGLVSLKKLDISQNKVNNVPRKAFEETCKLEVHDDSIVILCGLRRG